MADQGEIGLDELAMQLLEGDPVEDQPEDEPVEDQTKNKYALDTILSMFREEDQPAEDEDSYTTPPQSDMPPVDQPEDEPDTVIEASNKEKLDELDGRLNEIRMRIKNLRPKINELRTKPIEQLTDKLRESREKIIEEQAALSVEQLKIALDKQLTKLGMPEKDIENAIQITLEHTYMNEGEFLDPINILDIRGKIYKNKVEPFIRSLSEKKFKSSAVADRLKELESIRDEIISKNRDLISSDEPDVERDKKIMEIMDANDKTDVELGVSYVSEPMKDPRVEELYNVYHSSKDPNIRTLISNQINEMYKEGVWDLDTTRDFFRKPELSLAVIREIQTLDPEEASRYINKKLLSGEMDLEEAKRAKSYLKTRKRGRRKREPLIMDMKNKRTVLKSG